MLAKLLFILLLGVSANAEPQDDFSVCPVGGRERLWAQKRLNADLMNQYIATHHLRDPNLKVRLQVVDTGFDQNQIPNLVRSSSFTELPGVYGKVPSQIGKDPAADPSATGDTSLVGIPGDDVGGHGTMVVSVIGGVDGIGVAPNTDITLSRITPNSDAAHAEMTDNAFIDYAILRACSLGRAADRNGLIIINDSWALREEEDGALPLIKRNPNLVKALSDQGCLLVKAAGNAAFVGPLPLQADDGSPILSVSATQPFNTFASFSSTGEVSASGESVFALASHSVTRSARNDLCNLSDANALTPRTFVSGTSFASPMTAGIAAEVVGVLRSLHPGEFDVLRPATKIKVVKQLLEASSLNRHGLSDIDGLRAALLAERWTNSVESVDDFRTLLKNNLPTLCSQTPNDYDSKRAFLSACSDRLDDAQFDLLAADLQNQALASKAFESAAGFLSIASPSDAATESFANLYLQDKIPNFKIDQDLADASAQRKLQLSLEASFSQFIMLAHLRISSGHARYLMTGLLTSWSTQQYLERGPGRGSEVILKSLVDNLEQINSVDLPNVLKDFTHYWFSLMAKDMLINNANAITPVIRVLNEVRNRPSLAVLTPYFDALDLEVLAQLDLFVATFGKKFDPLAQFGEVFQNRAYAFTLFDRQQAQLAAMKTQANPEKGSELKMEYLVENALVGDLHFLAKVQNQIGIAEAWKFSPVDFQTNTLPAKIQGLLLAGNDNATKIWFSTIDAKVPAVVNFIDGLVYQIAVDLDGVQSKFNQEGRGTHAPLSAKTLSEMNLLQASLANVSSKTALMTGNLGLSRLRTFRMSIDFSPKSAFSKSFRASLSSI